MTTRSNTLVAASNVLAPAFYLLKEQGYWVSYDSGNEWWIAAKGKLQFLVDSTIELCGLVYIHEHSGAAWGVSTAEIDACLQLEMPESSSSRAIE